jgi:membrane protein implicated in regulation of membrane protease activity
VPQGFDRYIGEKRTVKKSAWELKISLDGVEYIVDADEDIAAWDKVEILWHKGTGMKVKKAN